MHVLVIEDNSIISLSIRSALREFDFDTVATARTESGAVEAAHDTPPDLITCDVDLDPGSGLDAIASITDGQLTRVVFITSQGDAVRKRYPKATVVDKPFHSEELTETVRKMLKQEVVTL